MSHVLVAGGGDNNMDFAPGHSGDDPDPRPEEQAAQHELPCLNLFCERV